jgi:serine/threonine protein kinase
MSSSVSMPDEGTLRGFLLGTLAPERTQQVEAWLSSDPAAAETLTRIAANDSLTRALADTATVEAVPVQTVDWVVRSVLHELGRETATGSFLLSAERGSEEGPDATLPLPAKLGVYRVVRELGRGGMGIVLEADDEELHRRVAVKVLVRERAQDPAAKARFLQEARAAAAIEHENVVPIYHVGEDSGVPFIVMPLLRGESLDARLQRDGGLPPAEVIRLGREVTAGLAAAHARGLVHRDIKPANIWLASETGKAILLDFGLARAADGAEALTAPGVVPGTPAFMAPELLDGKPADARSDLFSLGATLYRCATGQPAFAGPTLTAILKAVAAHEPPPPRQVCATVPGPLSELIMRLLAKSPSVRPQSAQQVLADLFAVSEPPTMTDTRPPAFSPFPDTSEVPVSPPPPREREGWGRRRRWAVPIAAVAAVLLAAIGGWLVLHTPRQEGVPEPSPTDPPPQVHYEGKVNVRVRREGRFLSLHEPGALPLRKTDEFRIEGEVKPPAYLYVVWVEPGHDVTPVYPWNPLKGWGSRPKKEKPVGRLSLPDSARGYTVQDAKVGVATMVLFARPTPLDVPDEVVQKWFEGLPDLPLPFGGEQAAVWFDNYVEVMHDVDRPRTFGVVGSDDAFARWQGQLQKVLGDKAAFQTAVSFARTGGK